MKRKRLPALVSGIAMVMLILDSAHAAKWASEGIELCIRAVIPALFPFFAVSVFLTGNLGSLRLLSPAARCFRVSDGAIPVLVCGFLGGYPVGAHSTAEQWKKGIITTAQAKRMLSFCSQAGPSFLFGMVSGSFTHTAAPWALWGIQLFSAWLVSRVFSGEEISDTAQEAPGSIGFPEAMAKAMRAMAGVCGWVILFRVILGFCGRWFLWLFPQTVQVLLCGLLELTNGCCQLNQISNESLRFVICAVIMNFGGLCVLMQTMSAAGPLGIQDYLAGKILQILFALVISLAVCGMIPLICLVMLIPVVLFTGKRRKISRFPVAFGV